jgi:hypothetical protein
MCLNAPEATKNGVFEHWIGSCLQKAFKAGVPNLGDAYPWGDLRGVKSVIFWVLLYQWGDANGLGGDAETKRLGTPALKYTLKTAANITMQSTLKYK